MAAEVRPSVSTAMAANDNGNEAKITRAAHDTASTERTLQRVDSNRATRVSLKYTNDQVRLMNDIKQCH